MPGSSPATPGREGGNVTGFAVSGPAFEGKRLQILQEVVPGLSRVAVLWNSANPAVLEFYQQTQAAAAALGVALQPVVEVRRADDLQNAFSMVAGGQAQAMIVLQDRLLLALRAPIVSFAATGQLPAIYPYRGYVDAGGLMSYAVSDIDQFQRAAVYVDKVLKGEKPADLPVQNPTKFELVINLKTAKGLGLDVPLHLQQLADEVIE
jgi:putative tryptophan/tyrosine transport system substrate-binding protein